MGDDDLIEDEDDEEKDPDEEDLDDEDPADDMLLAEGGDIASMDDEDDL